MKLLLALFAVPLQIVNFLLQHFDVQLQLLLHLDVVADFALVLLQLQLVLLRRQVQRLEGRRKLRGRAVISLAEALQLGLLDSVLIVIQFHLHEDFYTGADVVQHRQAVQLGQAFALLRKLILLKHVDLHKQESAKGLEFTSSLDRILTCRYKSIMPSCTASPELAKGRLACYY